MWLYATHNTDTHESNGIFSSLCKTSSRDIDDVLMSYLSYLDSFQVNLLINLMV